jgi:hypothetical protein
VPVVEHDLLEFGLLRERTGGPVPEEARIAHARRAAAMRSFTGDDCRAAVISMLAVQTKRGASFRPVA